MTKRIGIEEGLSPVRDYLIRKGYDVQTVENNQDFRGFDAIVMTGLENNVQGISDSSTKSPVIEASGMTPEEIYNYIKTTIG